MGLKDRHFLCMLSTAVFLSQSLAALAEEDKRIRMMRAPAPFPSAPPLRPGIYSAANTRALISSPRLRAPGPVVKDNATQTARLPEQKPDKAVISANNLFGFDLLRSFLKKEVNQNVVISPLSINLALSMTAAGAAGATKDTMLKTLKLSGIPANIIRNSHGLILSSMANEDPQVKIAIADSIWTDKSTAFKSSFLKTNQKLYDAELKSVDYSAPTTVSTINNWVKQKTFGKIPSIINDINSNDKMIILNAVYFKGLWSSPFKEQRTQQGDFTLLTGSVKKIPMMEATKTLSYLKGNGFQAIKLPYGQEQRFEMWLFLPDAKPWTSLIPFLLKPDNQNKQSYEKFLEHVTNTDWNTLESTFSNEPVYIMLPKFKIDMEKSLTDNLKAMGMSLAFNADRADFSEMFILKPQDRAYISEAKHKTYIDVNENGTEAAAITVVSASKQCAAFSSPSSPKQFRADHPFLFGIRDSSSGAILFLGSITDPI